MTGQHRHDPPHHRDLSRLNQYLLQVSAVKLLIILICSLTVAEMLVMFLMEHSLPKLPMPISGIVDAMLLLLCVFPTLYLLVFRPLTLKIARLNQAESSLRESESTIMALMNSLNESAFLIAADGTVITLNMTAASRLGKSREELIGKNIFEYFPPDVAEMRRLKVDEATRTSRNVRFQDVRNGRHFDITVSPVTNNAGLVVKLAIFAFDTTGYHEAEQMLKANALALERSNNEVRLLGKMSETLQSCHSLEEAYDVLAKFANQLLPDESGALYILDSDRNLLDLVSFWGDFWATSDSIAPEECWAMRRGRLHVFRDIMQDVQCAHQGESGDYHYYCLPLMARSETLGMLHLRMARPADGGAGRMTQETKEQLLESMAEHMALAIANLRLRNQLHYLSTRDPLTGVFNRRFMEESLTREICQAERSRRPVGVIMLDIDHFKRFNDTLGHEAGDQLLKELGGMLQQQVRGGDIVCRYGGEEFIIILPGAGEEEAVQRAEQIRHGVKAINLPQFGGNHALVSVSLGVASYPRHGIDGGRLVRAADDALYRAKHEGRDRVCQAEVQPVAPSATGTGA